MSEDKKKQIPIEDGADEAEEAKAEEAEEKAEDEAAEDADKTVEEFFDDSDAAETGLIHSLVLLQFSHISPG